MKNLIIIFAVILLSTSSCKKFLDEKPRKSLAIPETLADIQALLEKEAESQRDFRWGELSADDYTYDNATLAGLNEIERKLYSWDSGDVFGNASETEWLQTYRMVYFCNTAFETLEHIERTTFNAQTWDKAKGEASFFRAKCFLSVANIWAKGYNPATANTDLGIPLRLNTNFNEQSERSTLAQTYNQIISDLEVAIPLLPTVASHVVRPSKAAALGLLARVYLMMGRYGDCLTAADA